MENKNLDGQLSFDTEIENNEQSVTENQFISSVEFEIGKPAEKDNLVFEVSEEKAQSAPLEIIEPVVEELVIGKPPIQSPVEKKIDTPQAQPSTPPQQAQPARRAVYVPIFH